MHLSYSSEWLFQVQPTDKLAFKLTRNLNFTRLRCVVLNSLMARQQNAVCSISDNIDSLITLNVSIWRGIYTLELATVIKRYQKEAPGTCLILKTHTKWFDQTETTQHLLSEMTFQWWRCRYPNIWLVMQPSLLTPTVIVCVSAPICVLLKMVSDRPGYDLISETTSRWSDPFFWSHNQIL